MTQRSCLPSGPKSPGVEVEAAALRVPEGHDEVHAALGHVELAESVGALDDPGDRVGVGEALVAGRADVAVGCESVAADPVAQPAGPVAVAGSDERVEHAPVRADPGLVPGKAAVLVLHAHQISAAPVSSLTKSVHYDASWSFVAMLVALNSHVGMLLHDAPEAAAGSL